MARFNIAPLRLVISVFHELRGSRAQLELFTRATQTDLLPEPSQLDLFVLFFFPKPFISNLYP